MNCTVLSLCSCSVLSLQTTLKKLESNLSYYTQDICLWFLWFNQLLPDTLETRRKLKKDFSIVLPYLHVVFLFFTRDEWLMLSTGYKFRLKSMFIPKVNYRTVLPEKLFFWPPVCLFLASDQEQVVNFFICEECWLSFGAFGVSWRLKKLCIGQLAWIVTFFSQNVHFHRSLIRIDFAVRVPCGAVRISSRAVRIFLALSLRRVKPSCGTFFFIVFQGNFARHCMGHTISTVIVIIVGGISKSIKNFGSKNALWELLLSENVWSSFQKFWNCGKHCEGSHLSAHNWRANHGSF